MQMLLVYGLRLLTSWCELLWEVLGTLQAIITCLRDALLRVI